MAAVNQQVIVAVNMTTFLLLLSSFLLDLFSISEAVIFMEFPLPYQKPQSEPRDISFLYFSWLLNQLTHIQLGEHVDKCQSFFKTLKKIL